MLQLMHYDDPRLILRSRVYLTFSMCGEERHAQTDVCVVDENRILLIFQENKRHVGLANPEGQLVFEAIAAF
jgi:hypothetical protein